MNSIRCSQALLRTLTWFKFIFLTAALTVAISSPLFAATLACKHLDVIEQGFLHQHILYSSFTDTLQAHTIDQYIKHLDASKIYLSKADVDSIKAKMGSIFKNLKDGNCASLDDVQALLVKRVEERAEYAKKLLSDKKFKFEPKTELLLDPDAREYAKSKADADKFQAKYIQFQISNYLATGTSQEEAQQTVVRNYERIVKRVKDTTQEDIYASYLDAFGRALDPHSSFFSRDSLEDFNITMGLSLEGIGATLSSQDGFTVVEQLIAGGSAQQSGKIKPQDKIVAVGQYNAKGEAEKPDNVQEMDLRDVVRRIRGPKGSKVQLVILRKTPQGNEHVNVTLTREKIKLEDEAASISYVDREVLGQKKKIAILNLPSFYSDGRRDGRSSATDMKVLLKDAREKKADALVLDFSNNGGGSLDDAVRIAGLFFKTGNVVKQSSRDSSDEITLDDKDAMVDWDGPLVVLTSRISASASEIVAGTLKDYKRAVIVGGDHTFGKGSVQSVVPLPPGLGALKVTVGMFFTPGGFSTQHRGVEGDIVFPGPFATDDIGEKSLDYSLPPKRIKEFLSPEAYVTSGVGAWKKIDQPTIDFLKGRAQPRVAKNEEFIKIATEMKKTKERGKTIKLSDALKETKDKKEEQEKKKELSKEEKVAEYEKRPDVQEAANVAGDLLEALSKPSVVIGAKEKTLRSSGVPEDTKKTGTTNN
jgi:carboxyl-terminal processing protease